MTMTDRKTAGHGPALLVAWLVVGVPLAWGVIQTLINASKLFR